MPTADPPPRRPARPSRLLRLLAAGAIVLAAVGGCSDIADGSPGVQRTDLVTDLAGQLEASSTLTYAAEYRLSGGAIATITQAQTPPRSAYVYPGGMVSVTADATIACRTRLKHLTCTLIAPPAPASRPPATLFTEIGQGGMVAPPIVLDLLNAAALDTEAVVEQHDSTIAGRHATCVGVSNVHDAAASRFGACVTTEGVLGSFTGTVDGAAIDVAMTHYQETINGRIFDPPATAEIIDRR